MATRTRNDIQKEMKGVMLYTLVKIKSLLIEFYLSMYKTPSFWLWYTGIAL